MQHQHQVVALLRKMWMTSAMPGEERRREDSQDVPDSNCLHKAAIKGSTLKLDCLEQPIAAKLVELTARTAPIYRAVVGWAPRFGHA